MSYSYGLRVADLKRSYLYKILPVKTEMAFLSCLSRILIRLAILLYEQYTHHTQASLICLQSSDMLGKF